MRWTPPWTHYTKLNGSVCWLKIPTDSVDATNRFVAHSIHIRYISQQDDRFESAYVRQSLSSRMKIATMMTRHRRWSVSLHCQTEKQKNRKRNLRLFSESNSFVRCSVLMRCNQLRTRTWTVFFRICIACHQCWWIRTKNSLLVGFIMLLIQSTFYWVHIQLGICHCQVSGSN